MNAEVVLQVPAELVTRILHAEHVANDKPVEHRFTFTRAGDRGYTVECVSVVRDEAASGRAIEKKVAGERFLSGLFQVKGDEIVTTGIR